MTIYELHGGFFELAEGKANELRTESRKNLPKAERTEMLGWLDIPTPSSKNDWDLVDVY